VENVCLAFLSLSWTDLLWRLCSVPTTARGKKIFVTLEWYVAKFCSWLPTFRDMSVQSWRLKMLPSGYPKTPVTIYHPAPRNIPEQRGPQLQSLLKSRNERMLGSCFDVTGDTRLLELFEFGRRSETQRCYGLCTVPAVHGMELKCKMLY